jgi:hypothetical protein
MADPLAQAAGRVDTWPVDALASAFRDAVRGPKNSDALRVVWNDRGAQLMLYVDSLLVRVVETMLVVAVDTETVEFGRAPLIVRFVFGADSDMATLVAATDETAHGHPVIAARWGELFRSVIWAALVRLVVTLAGKGGLQARSISLGEDQLTVRSDAPASIRQLAQEHVRAGRPGKPPQASGVS